MSEAPSERESAGEILSERSESKDPEDDGAKGDSNLSSAGVSLQAKSCEASRRISYFPRAKDIAHLRFETP